MARALDIEAAVALAEAQTGTHKPGGSSIALVAEKPKRSRFWTKAEEQFLRDNYGRLSETEIGRRLGRTQPAIENHAKRELHLTPPSKQGTVLTGEHVAMGLCVDGKSVHLLCDRGILPCRRQAGARALPGWERAIRLVDRHVFMRWLLDPMNWVYFKPERVGKMIRRGKRAYTNVYDEEFWELAAKALGRARRKWKDKWLTSRQAGRILKVTHHNINAAILKGNLQATRWANWWILRSHLPKTGTFDATGKWVPRILTHSELGKRNFKKFWEDVHAGRRPWFSNGGHNRKNVERKRFFKLIGKEMDIFQAARRLKVSTTTCYKWLKERHGKNWQPRCASSRQSKKAKFLELFKKLRSVNKAAQGAGVHAGSCYRWLHEEGWRTGCGRFAKWRRVA